MVKKSIIKARELLHSLALIYLCYGCHFYDGGSMRVIVTKKIFSTRATLSRKVNTALFLRVSRSETELPLRAIRAKTMLAMSVCQAAKRRRQMPLRLQKCPRFARAFFRLVVRLTGLEPALLTEMEPKSIVYANFTTGAYSI